MTTEGKELKHDLEHNLEHDLEPDQKSQEEFCRGVMDQLQKNANVAKSAKVEPSAFLYGVDWERVSHGKGESAGKVIVAQGRADAMLKWNQLIHYKPIKDILGYEEFEEMCKKYSISTRVARISIIDEAIKLLEHFAIRKFEDHPDGGLCEWEISVM